MKLYVLFMHSHNAVTKQACRLAGSRWSHCVVTNGTIAIERNGNGINIFTHERAISVPGRRVVEVDAIWEPSPGGVTDIIKRYGCHNSRLSSLMGFVTRGRYPNNNCVQAVVDILADCGIVLSGHIVTPDQLFEGLMGWNARTASLRLSLTMNSTLRCGLSTLTLPPKETNFGATAIRPRSKLPTKRLHKGHYRM